MEPLSTLILCAVSAAIAYLIGHNRGEMHGIQESDQHTISEVNRTSKASYDKGYTEGYDQGTRQGYHDGRLYEQLARQNTQIINHKKGKIYDDIQHPNHH